MSTEAAKIGKLKVLDRGLRMVSYTRGHQTIRLMLKSEPRCNAGDVQRIFNHHIRNGRGEEAVSFLMTKKDRYL